MTDTSQPLSGAAPAPQDEPYFQDATLVTNEQACNAALALIDHFFKNGKRKVKVCIPAEQDDTDTLLMRYLRQQKPAAAPVAVPAQESEDILERYNNLRAELEGLDIALGRIEGKDGFVTGYTMKTGIWHRILGMIRQAPAPLPPPQTPAALARETRTEAENGCHSCSHLIGYHFASLPEGKCTVRDCPCEKYLMPYSRLHARIAQLEPERTEIMTALCITTFTEDGEVEYEVPAEPEPVYVPTLKEAIQKTIQLCENDCKKAEDVSKGLEEALREVQADRDYLADAKTILMAQTRGGHMTVNRDKILNELTTLRAQKSALMEAIKPWLNFAPTKTEIDNLARVYEQVKEKR